MEPTYTEPSYPIAGDDTTGPLVLYCQATCLLSIVGDEVADACRDCGTDVSIPVRTAAEAGALAPKLGISDG